MDQSAIDTLGAFLKSDGRINTNFSSRDKWPNIDGTFEFVTNPDVSRNPTQNFFVQIKGTESYSEINGEIKFTLQSLAFPAYLLFNVTADPGILFVILNPTKKGKERVFWKYMSIEFMNSIDFNKDSKTITFSKDEEITYTNESIDIFCKKLQHIIKYHSFSKKLESREYELSDVEKIIKRCDDEIVECISKINKDNRDIVSQHILPKLYDLCRSALFMHALKNGEPSISLQLAWEKALLNIKTKYLASFLVMLKYIDNRVPEDGQSERLMLKYYDFMWQIKSDLKKFGYSILANLNDFPLEDQEDVDTGYYQEVAREIEKMPNITDALHSSRYYIQKKNSFYVNNERYYELSLQLAGIYATKYNRITVYTKENISTDYSIQIGYSEVEIDLWDIRSKIKVVTNWKVSIDPTCLNSLSKILNIPCTISSRYGEYTSLMTYLTKTGANLLDLIDLKEISFSNIIEEIYNGCKTSYFKPILMTLRDKFKIDCDTVGKNAIRYILVRMKEEIIKSVFPQNNEKLLYDCHYIISGKCFPFEKSPLIANFARSKTSKYTITKDVIRAVGYKDLEINRPYLTIKKLIGETKEIYFDRAALGDDFSDEKIKKYNNHLDNWEQSKGFKLVINENHIHIDSFEQETFFILSKLKEISKSGNEGQDKLNNRFLNSINHPFEDKDKEFALKKVFVDSSVLLIYGAAGTGKTTLINHISNLMEGRRKLFLTKTYAALQNLERRIDNPANSDFISIDSFSKKANLADYDIIFVDECSTIDNLTMQKFLSKIRETTLLVLSGDIYQLESIDFGNWFYYAKDIIKDSAKVELLNTWRSDVQTIKDLWNEVRNCGHKITEILAVDGPFSKQIDKDIFKPEDKDEVILCLNYDGKWGLNNINTYFQNANTKSAPFYWKEWSYKIGDPILFNESKRFPILYNNLKGRIFNIEQSDGVLTFTVDIKKLLTKADCNNIDVQYIHTGDDYTRLKFSVYDMDEELTEENRIKTVVPFQLAYAVSIHKSQGLEYNSVKIVIPDSNSEQITHGIFYTAITRAKKHLKIYWGDSTMKKIISSFECGVKKGNSLDILRKKL
jgi:hypothetical protein